MADVRLKLKIGALEVECEGSEEFVGGRLSGFIEQMLSLNLPDVVHTGAASLATHPTQISGVGTVSSPSKLSTTDFAVKMGAKSGSDLVMAAAAYLHHTTGSEEFRRSEILGCMRGAKAFYKPSYGSNLSKSLEILTKSGRLQNPRSDVYALPYSEIESTVRLL